MKTLKNTTKTAQYYIDAYNRSNAGSLRDCYGRFSDEKARAEYFCRRSMDIEGGTGFKIISASRFYFSAAWLVGDSLRVRTVANDFLIPEAI